MSRVSLVRLEKGRRISEGRLALETLGDPLTIEPSAEVQMAKRNMAPEMGAVHNSGYGNSRKADGLDYSIAAIPTVYRGRKYRSRLEAKWAAFFDRLGWRHEYEPYDLGKWSPDFLLTGANGSTVLVEVKPITEFDPAVANKMCAAAFARGFQNEASYLLVGVAPILHAGASVQIGWLGSPHEEKAAASWAPAPIAWCIDHEVPSIAADVLHVDPNGHGWGAILSDYCGPGFPSEGMFYGQHTMRLWSEATNAAQWEGPGA